MSRRRFKGDFFNKRSVHGIAAENVSKTDNIFDSRRSRSVVLSSAEGTVTFSGNKYLSEKPIIQDTDAVLFKDF